MRTKPVGFTRVALLLCIAAVALAVLSGCAEPLSEEQRLEDLDYLMRIFSENHPFIALKSRVEGYDWLGHRDEFRALVASAETDQEFAIAMNSVVRLVNNMHTRLSGRSNLDGWYQVPRSNDLEPWLRIIDEASLNKAEYWFDLAKEQEYGHLEIAYSAGQYVVAGRVTGTTGKTFPIGSVVTEVNGMGVDEFVYSHRGIDWQPYDPVRQKVYDRVLRLPEGKSTVTVTAPDGYHITETFNVRASVPPRSLVMTGRYNGPYTLNSACLSGCVMDGEVGYLVISHMVGDSKLLEDEIRALREFIDSVSGLPSLIIDIRGNPGGQDLLWCALVSMLISKTTTVELAVALADGDYVSPFYSCMVDSYGFAPLVEEDTSRGFPPEVSNGGFRVPITGFLTVEPDEDSVKYSGRVFLLVDDQVCSSADLFAAFSKASGFATLVGGVTGGDGIGFRLCYAVLPNSGMVVSFSLNMGLNPDGTANEETHTRPHHLVEWTPTDISRWMQYPGRWHDVVLQECLRLAKTP